MKTEHYRKLLRITSKVTSKINPKIRFYVAKFVKIEGFRTLFDPNSIRNYSRIREKDTLRKVKLIAGCEMYVNLNDIIGFRTALNGSWDDTAFKIVQQFSNKNTLYIDIGANIGLTSIPIANLDYETVAFEPNPVALKLLAQNLTLNAPNRYYLFPFALGANIENVEIMDLFMPRGNLGASSPNFDWSPGVDTLLRFSVPKISLDKAVSLLFPQRSLNRFENVVIKLDVEGHEDSVMEGAEELIKVKRPIVIFENNPPKSPKSSGIRFWSNWSNYTFLGISKFEAEDFDEKKRYENVIAIPNEKSTLLNKEIILRLIQPS